MTAILAVGRDPTRLVHLDKVLTAQSDGKVYLGVNDHDLFRGLALRNYDLLVLDMDGSLSDVEALLHRLREAWPTLPILVIGTEEIYDESERITDAGASRVLPRSAKLGRIRHALKLLKRQAAQVA